MDHYEIWCNLRNSHKDMEFAEAVQFVKDSTNYRFC